MFNLICFLVGMGILTAVGIVAIHAKATADASERHTELLEAIARDIQRVNMTGGSQGSTQAITPPRVTRGRRQN